MGTIKQGILGGFSGKVGTVVGSSWKGISYMRGQAQSVKNPRTAKQMAQRDKFALALSFVRPIQSFIKIGFKTYATRQTAFNAAMSYTLKNVIKGTYPSFTIDYTQAKVSRGSLAKPLNIQKQNNNNEIAVSWNDNSGTANALDTDFAMIMAYNAEKKEAVYDIATACRGDEGASLQYPSDWVGDTVHIYLAFVSEDGTLVSDSDYVGSETIE
jgi:hypothetical protein